MEKILCAAILVDDGLVYEGQPINVISGLLIVGYRHQHAIYIAKALFDELLSFTEGFLTSKHRFVSREEAARIAFDAGQIQDEIDVLVSEDLY